MVFYYSIRGGTCLNNHSHINLTSQDIVCYVGRDKHENEYLIKYGWPGDIWFHVDGLSSAHVYFRLKNIGTVSSIPIDSLPPDSVADMMQICKNNSIAGCKLASCKMVYTPHSNLKKTFDMESGAVTYHDTKMCRYARCEKDRTRVRELEKTKTPDMKVDYFQEMKDNERGIIERKKRMRKAQNDELYDPIQDDLNTTKMKAGRQGDTESGLDAGLDALEGMSFAPVAVSGPSDGNEQNEAFAPESPLWVREEESREGEPSGDVRFLRERGYSSSEATSACYDTTSCIAALSKLYNAAGNDPSESPLSSVDVPEEVVQARIEEKEVLMAMFGFAYDDEEAAATFSDMEDETIFDVVLPISGYEAPDRYESPPPLMLEVYVDSNIAPLYPNEPPVLAVVGGGFSEARLRELTKIIQAEALERAREEPGEPQFFNLIAFVGEAAEGIVQKEAAELKAARMKILEAEKAAAALLRDAQKEENPPNPNSSGGGFTSEAERRAYAKDVAAKAGFVANADEDDGKKVAKPKFNAKTGVSDRSLINDLFG